MPTLVREFSGNTFFQNPGSPLMGTGATQSAYDNCCGGCNKCKGPNSNSIPVSLTGSGSLLITCRNESNEAETRTYQASAVSSPSGSPYTLTRVGSSNTWQYQGSGLVVSLACTGANCSDTGTWTLTIQQTYPDGETITWTTTIAMTCPGGNPTYTGGTASGGCPQMSGQCPPDYPIFACYSTTSITVSP